MIEKNWQNRRNCQRLPKLENQSFAAREEMINPRKIPVI